MQENSLKFSHLACHDALYKQNWRYTHSGVDNNATLEGAKKPQMIIARSQLVVMRREHWGAPQWNLTVNTEYAQ